MKKRLLLGITLFIFLLSCLSVFAKDKEEIIVKLKDSFETSSKIVKLKDLGMVIGDKRLENLTIVTFRNQGENYLINKQLVYNNILNFYLKNKEVVPKIRIFSKNGNVKIKRKSYFVTFEKVQNIIRNFLKENSEKIFKNKKWKIVKIIAPEKIKIDDAKVDIKVTLLNEKIFFKLPFILEFLNSNRKKIKSVKIFVITEVKDLYVVAVRDISLRKIVTLDDVKVAEAKVRNNRMNYFRNISQVVGKITKRYIRRGEVINDRMIAIPPMVKRGEIVNVVAENNGGIVISMKGKALENGYYNKNIRILNSSSGKVIVGTVKGYGKVVVNF